MTPTKRVPASHGPLEIQDQQDLPENHIKTDRSKAPFVSRAANVQLQLRTNLPFLGKFSMEILMSKLMVSPVLKATGAYVDSWSYFASIAHMR
jgi:hypothetical protein